MRRAAFLSIIMMLIITLLLPGAVPVGAAAAAAGPTWSSAIVYFNPTNSGSGDTMSVMYFKSSGETILTDPNPLKGYQSGVLLIGSILRDSAFKGSAVISATVPLVALYMQTATGGEPYSPVIYNTFDSSKTSSDGGYFVPDVQLGTSYKVMLGVQNVESDTMNLNLRLIPEGNPGGVIEFTDLTNLKPQESYIVNVSELEGVPANFSGSMYLWGSTSVVSNARMVAALRAVQTGGRRAFGYEGVAAGNPVIFMPAASCKLGGNQQTSSYAVQNTSNDNPAEVRVDYYTPTGEFFASYPASGTLSITPLAMKRINTCDPVSDGKDTTGKYLAAVIRSTNDVPIAATGSVTSNDGLATGFTGQSTPAIEKLDALRDTNGKYHIALPYVYFTSDPNGIRTYISLMNASDTADGSPAAATDIKITYYGRDGSEILKNPQILASAGGPLAVNGKVSTDPMSAGAIDVGAAGFYGAALIESDQPLVALVRVQRNVSVTGYSTLGDDYNGVYVQP